MPPLGAEVPATHLVRARVRVRVGVGVGLPTVSGSAEASCPEVIGTAPHAWAFMRAMPEVSGLSLG
eukprot:scaffold47252_cov59-Phaeocystis_antarctica.AAC.2